MRRINGVLRSTKKDKTSTDASHKWTGGGGRDAVYVCVVYTGTVSDLPHVEHLPITRNSRTARPYLLRKHKERREREREGCSLSSLMSV